MGERGAWPNSSMDAGSCGRGMGPVGGAQPAPRTGCPVWLQLQFGKGWQSQLLEGEWDLLKRCRAAAAGSSGLDWQCVALSCAAGPGGGLVAAEPSAGSEPGSPGPKVRCPQENPNFWVVKWWKRSHLLPVLCGEISCAPAAGQRRLIRAQQRGCSSLPAAGDSLMCCPNRTSPPLGRAEAVLLQRQLCLHLLGPGTHQEGLELLPEGCSGTVTGRRAGGACNAGQRGIGVLLGRLWAVALMLCC